MDGETKATRSKIREEIHEACGRYLDTLGDEYEGGHISAFYAVAEVVLPNGRTLLEIGDEQSSKYTSMGMLHAALYDPRWLDPERDT